MITSVSYNQYEILENITTLYIRDQFDADITYGRGNFYKKNVVEPRYKFDRSPQYPDVICADSRCLPISSGTLRSIVFDPPFLATTGPSLYRDSGNIIAKRFTVFPDEISLHQYYYNSLIEIYRVLCYRGFCIIKCQDKVSSGKQYFSHVFMINSAIEIGFYPIDMFILLAKSRLIAQWQRQQKHARKFHSYFLVLQKIHKTVNYIEDR